MTSLHPTPNRLKLLRDIADGHVLVEIYGQAVYADENGNAWGARVTARWRELKFAGWVVRPEGDPKWQPGVLTAAGRAVLDGARDGGK